MPTIKSLILLFAAVASQIYGTDAASRVVNDGTDQYNRRYANLIYDESDMPWHASHLYWHYCRYPHHERNLATNVARYYRVLGQPRSQGQHHANSQNAIGNIVPQGQAGYVGHVRDEKMPAFVDHSPNPANEVTVFYLPRDESNREGGLTSAAANYDFVRFSVQLTGQVRTSRGVSIPIKSLDDLQNNAGEIKASQGGGDKGLLEPAPGSSSGRGPAVARDLVELDEPETIRTRKDLLNYLQRRKTKKPSTNKPADTKPSTNKPADTKPADTKPADTKPADTKPADTKPADTKPADTKPADTKPADTKPADTKPRPSNPPKPTITKASNTLAPSKTTNPKSTGTKSSATSTATNAPKEPTLKKQLPPKGECPACKDNSCAQGGKPANPSTKPSGSAVPKASGMTTPKPMAAI